MILSGCSGGPDPLDAGADAGVDAGAALPLPAAPLPVALPDFATCPDGWVREPIGSGGERSACVPWAVDAPECPPGETRIPGRGCVRIGGACPSGEWPDGIGADAIHVRAGEVGGDGSEAAPFGTVFEALAEASDGDVVAIAAGTYDGPVIVSAAITLWGILCRASNIAWPSRRDGRGARRGAGGGPSQPHHRRPRRRVAGGRGRVGRCA